MAPTELLAEQHARTVAARLAGTPFRSVLLTGNQRSVARREALAAIAGGDAALVVGTHAVLEDPTLFKRLGLVIIDEQHRFGVGQRARLRRKGRHPDVLVMTATPIPRTLTLTAYGDLDVSVIRDLPPGRKPVQTTARPETRREDAYAFVRAQVAEGRQAYVVLPGHRGQRQDRRARRRQHGGRTARGRPRRPSPGAPARQAEGRREAGA